jgi:arylsulfatase A-like enzyme
MDEEMGKVLAAREQKGMRANTLVVFMGDNGGTTLATLAGEADVSKLTFPADNSPYRGGKGMLYEGGTRVAALAKWPGQIKPGAMNEVVHVVNMFPTLAGIAGADPGAGKPLDGINA